MKKIVKFTKSACPHCTIFDPIFKDTLENYKDKIEFFEVSLDDAPHMRDIFQIRGVPSLYQFESDDFKSFSNIEQLVIGHSHESYKDLASSLDELVRKQ